MRLLLRHIAVSDWRASGRPISSHIFLLFGIICCNISYYTETCAPDSKAVRQPVIHSYHVGNGIAHNFQAKRVECNAGKTGTVKPV